MSKKLYIVDWKKGTREKVIYSVELERLDEYQVKEGDPILAPLLPLIDRNVAFAAVPENFGEGVACYLLNLNSLKGAK